MTEEEQFKQDKAVWESLQAEKKAEALAARELKIIHYKDPLGGVGYFSTRGNEKYVLPKGTKEISQTEADELALEQYKGVK